MTLQEACPCLPTTLEAITSIKTLKKRGAETSSDTHPDSFWSLQTPTNAKCPVNFQILKT